MEQFENPSAQGDVYIMKLEGNLPAKFKEFTKFKEVKPENDKLIVTHSETGHHHVMDATKARMYELPDDIMKCLLVVNDPVALEHLRHYDTHEPIMFQPGNYLVRRQREHTPEGWRKAQD